MGKTTSVSLRENGWDARVADTTSGMVIVNDPAHDHARLLQQMGQIDCGFVAATSGVGHLARTLCQAMPVLGSAGIDGQYAFGTHLTEAVIEDYMNYRGPYRSAFARMNRFGLVSDAVSRSMEIPVRGTTFSDLTGRESSWSHEMEGLLYLFESHLGRIVATGRVAPPNETSLEPYTRLTERPEWPERRMIESGAMVVAPDKEGAYWCGYAAGKGVWGYYYVSLFGQSKDRYGNVTLCRRYDITIGVDVGVGIVRSIKLDANALEYDIQEGIVYPVPLRQAPYPEIMKVLEAMSDLVLQNCNDKDADAQLSPDELQCRLKNIGEYHQESRRRQLHRNAAYRQSRILQGETFRDYAYEPGPVETHALFLEENFKRRDRVESAFKTCPKPDKVTIDMATRYSKAFQAMEDRLYALNLENDDKLKELIELVESSKPTE